jgi:hypothetical protein
MFFRSSNSNLFRSCNSFGYGLVLKGLHGGGGGGGNLRLVGLKVQITRFHKLIMIRNEEHGTSGYIAG